MSNKRLLLRKKITPEDFPSGTNIRTVRESDGDILGELMLNSYRGTIDYEGETLQQSIEEMVGTLNGKYGVPNLPASFLALEGDRAIAAAIWVYYAKERMPLLAFTMTHPKFQGQGLSQSLIKRSLNELYQQGYQECCLVVTEGNQPAQKIYERLGFRE